MSGLKIGALACMLVASLAGRVHAQCEGRDQLGILLVGSEKVRHEGTGRSGHGGRQGILIREHTTRLPLLQHETVRAADRSHFAAAAYAGRGGHIRNGTIIGGVIGTLAGAAIAWDTGVHLAVFSVGGAGLGALIGAVQPTNPWWKR